jgi:hypothetical protein
MRQQPEDMFHCHVELDLSLTDFTFHLFPDKIIHFGGQPILEGPVELGRKVGAMEMIRRSSFQDRKLRIRPNRQRRDVFASSPFILGVDDLAGVGDEEDFRIFWVFLASLLELWLNISASKLAVGMRGRKDHWPGRFSDSQLETPDSVHQFVVDQFHPRGYHFHGRSQGLFGHQNATVMKNESCNFIWHRNSAPCIQSRINIPIY